MESTDFFYTSVEWLQLSERTSCSLPTYYSGLSLGKLLETSKLIWNTELQGPDWGNWRHCHCIIVLVVFLTWVKAMMNVMVLKMFVSFNCLSLAFTIFTVLPSYCRSLKNNLTFPHRNKLKEYKIKKIYECEFWIYSFGSFRYIFYLDLSIGVGISNKNNFNQSFLL